MGRMRHKVTPVIAPCTGWVERVHTQHWLYEGERGKFSGHQIQVPEPANPETTVRTSATKKPEEHTLGLSQGWRLIIVEFDSSPLQFRIRAPDSTASQCLIAVTCQEQLPEACIFPATFLGIGCFILQIQSELKLPFQSTRHLFPWKHIL